MWQAAIDVAMQRNLTLYGRADVHAYSCREIDLVVDSDPIPAKNGFRANPNHANIGGFPKEKQDQMSLAQVLATAANDQGGFKRSPI